MKQLQSKTEGAWVELLQVQLTEEEKTLLTSTQESDKEAKTSLAAEINIRRNGIATFSDIEVAQVKYLEIKPLLGVGDIYQLISMDCMLNGPALNGILNYRVNGNHKQIRF